MLCDELTAAILAALTEMREACAAELDHLAFLSEQEERPRMKTATFQAAAARIRAMEVK
jgi:hypothetical protein